MQPFYISHFLRFLLSLYFSYAFFTFHTLSLSLFVLFPVLSDVLSYRHKKVNKKHFDFFFDTLKAIYGLQPY